MAFENYSDTPSLNTTIAGQSVAPGGPRDAVGPAIRQLMADGKTLSVRVTVDTLTALKAIALPKGSVTFDGSIFTWETANAPYTADNVNVIKADSTPLSVGAWVRQKASAVLFDARRNVQQRLQQQVFVTDARYAGGAVGNGVADDTAAFQACAAECATTGATMRVPCGQYKITATIPVTNSFSILGDGTEKTIITLYSSSNIPLFGFSPADNTVILGARIAQMQIRCNGGSALCDGLAIQSAAVNSTIRQCHFDNLWIRDCRRGISFAGVFYRNTLSNITVQGTSDIGIYADAGFIDHCYNTLSQIEVTNVANGAWAYYVRSSYSTFDTMTSDGVAYFSSPGGVLRNYTTETVQASSFPAAAGGSVVTVNQMQLIDNFNIRGVDPAKRTSALRITGVSVVNAMRMVGPHPVNALLLDSGSSGVVNTLQVDSTINQIEQTNSETILNNWTFNNCFQVTKRSMRYAEGPWTPTFSGWTTPPTVINARYSQTGNEVTVRLVAFDGNAATSASISGLPVTSSAIVGGTMQLAGSDPTKFAQGRIWLSSTTIDSLPAVNLTGTFWQMTATYRAS